MAGGHYIVQPRYKPLLSSLKISLDSPAVDLALNNFKLSEPTMHFTLLPTPPVFPDHYDFKYIFTLLVTLIYKFLKFYFRNPLNVKNHEDTIKLLFIYVISSVLCHIIN